MKPGSLMIGLIAILSLLTAFAHASPAESLESCDTQGGEWRQIFPGTSSSWLHSCAVKWPEEKCKSGGANWDIPRRTCIYFPNPTDTKAQCVALGGVWGAHETVSEHCFFKQAKDACLREGGSWKPMGMLGRSHCLRSSRDGGRSCTDQSQCQFGCLAKKLPLSSTDSVVGACAADDNPFGCKTFVVNGKTDVGLCVD